MAVDFPTSPSDGDTVTVGTKTYSYNASKGVWKDIAGNDTTQSTLDNYLEVANSSSIGVTTYSALSDLPMSGQTTGKLAFVSGTNRLYIWNGTGWYNIALINTSPSISGASSSYSLNTDGSNTVVTLVASDPEGLPISFTASHTGLGVGANAIATVTQSNNIFTFTPTTNTALAGTFTTTFTASDGVNIAGANSSFTLAFTVNNSNYTTALITSVGGNNADNNDFVDSSTNSHTITAAGNATQTTFSPYRHGGYSTLVGVADGTDFLSAAQDTSLNGLFSGDFTIEFWFNKLTDRSQNFILSKGGGTTREWGIAVQSNSVIVYWSTQGTSGGDTSKTFSATIGLNEWHHLAVTFDQSTSTITAYLDGTSLGTNTFTSIYGGNGTLYVGRFMDYTAISHSCHAYITDLRIVKGSIVYSSAFTPPTERLTAITNTSLLACHLPYIADGSTNAHSITVNGNTKTEPFAPYDYSEYASGTHGGSMYFDGTDDYLNIAYDATIADWSSTDYTIEAWVNYKSFNVGAAGTPLILRHGTVGSATNYWSFGAKSTGVLQFYYYNGSAIGTCVSTATLSLNTWHHIVMSHNNTNNEITLYLDGVSVATHTVAGTPQYNSGSTIIVGELQGTDHYGHIADLRVTTSEVYSAAFTPPTSPLTAVTNTKLLLSGTNAGIIDKSQSVKTMTLNGDVKSSTTQSKYLTSSMYFDGTGDSIDIEDDILFVPASTAFTLEFWIKMVGGNSADAIFDWGRHNNGDSVCILSQSDGQFQVYTGNVVAFAGYGTSYADLRDGNWRHFALSRTSAGAAYTFVDGTVVESATGWTAAVASNKQFRISGLAGYANYEANFYMSDLRITKGLARYTANFTPPTAALQG